MIEIKAILKKYKALIVFENCSMTFEDNSINVIYGRNGIGKTTLLN
ncbi:MAG: AAA family ATPase, partial [Bacilli bacterium]